MINPQFNIQRLPVKPGEPTKTGGSEKRGMELSSPFPALPQNDCQRNETCLSHPFVDGSFLIVFFGLQERNAKNNRDYARADDYGQ